MYTSFLYGQLVLILCLYSSLHLSVCLHVRYGRLAENYLTPTNTKLYLQPWSVRHHDWMVSTNSGHCTSCR